LSQSHFKMHKIQCLTTDLAVSGVDTEVDVAKWTTADFSHESIFTIHQELWLRGRHIGWDDEGTTTQEIVKIIQQRVCNDLIIRDMVNVFSWNYFQEINRPFWFIAIINTDDVLILRSFNDVHLSFLTATSRQTITNLITKLSN